jgi:hypothetical protein
VVGRLGRAVAGYLGPIHRLWAPGRRVKDCWSEGLSAKVKVSAISRVSTFLSKEPSRLLSNILLRPCL